MNVCINFQCTYANVPVSPSVHLECPDTVLIERYGGKRVDSITGGMCTATHRFLKVFLIIYMYAPTDVYHLLFSPPENEDVAQRLVEEEGGIQTNLYAPLQLYHRLTDSLLASYTNTYKNFNADQPIEDLVSQGQLHVHVHTICTPLLLL